MQFQRPQHKIIQTALQSMESALLARCHCYFGGATLMLRRSPMERHWRRMGMSAA